MQLKYPSLSPYNFVANSPLIYIDPNGKEIIYVGTPEQVQAAKTLVSTAGKSAKIQTVIDKLQASDVKYYIIVGSKEAIAQQTGKNIDGGGITTYNFEGDNQGVQIGIENITTTPVNQIAAIADELTTGEQFEDGKLGFIKYSNGNKGSIGYDPVDELETKIAGANALAANGLSSADMDGQNSKKIVKAYEDTPKDKDGNISPKDTKALIDVMFTTAYKEQFKKMKIGKDDNISAAEGAKKADKGDKTIRRENGKTIIK